MNAPSSPGATATRRYLTLLIDLAGFVVVYAVLVHYFKPNLMLSLTTTTGGDTGAHINWAWYLKTALLPRGQIIGWSPDWYAGFPLFQFYFVVPYLLIATLSYLIPYQVAFKLVTVLGTFLLPITTYFAMKLMRFEFPTPVISALMTLSFLFMQSFSIYGANIMSTLAGEFTYSVSFALVVLLFGVVARGLPRGRLALPAALLLALVALNHIIPVTFAALGLCFFVPGKKWRRNLTYLAFVSALGFGLSAFWSLPFVIKLPYAVHMSWGQLRGFAFLFPSELTAFFVLAAYGLAVAVRTRDRRTYFLMWLLAVPALLYFLLPDGMFWNGRFLPFFYYYVLMWAAYGIFQLRHVFSFVSNKLLRVPQRYSNYLVAVLAAALLAVTVMTSVVAVADWIQWNYSGYEGKPDWPLFHQINDYMAQLPNGRIMWENSDSMEKFGTPEALMTLPYFSGQPTMESILLESAFTSPYHFVMQSELSDKASGAVQGITYPSLDMTAGVRHMRMFDVRYYIALSSRATKAANADPGLKLLTRIAEFSIYEVKDPGGYVVIPKDQPIRVQTRDWRTAALKWFSDPALTDAPLVLDNARAPALAGLPLAPASLKGAVATPMSSGGTVTAVGVGADQITFHTTAIGKPHWIKMSYFPNWKVEGADGPYLAAPSLMMVIPRRSDVRLYYGQTTVDIIANYLSMASAVLFVTLGVGTVVVRRRRSLPAQTSPSAEGDAGDAKPPSEPT